MNNQEIHTYKMLNPDQVAEMLNISKTTLYRLAGKRQIPFHKIGGVLRFSEKDVSEYLEKCRTEVMAM
jgi:excisionase family DNA binding protein